MRSPPGALTRSPGIHLGGAELLLVFLEQAYRLEMDELFVLAPYVDTGAFSDVQLRSAWERLLPMVDAAIVVRTPASADAFLRFSEGRIRGLDVRVNSRLHAKVFVACRRGSEVALTGSLNLTGAAMHVNDEVGILINPGAMAELRRLVLQLREVAVTALRSGTVHAAKTLDCVASRHQQRRPLLRAGDPLASGMTVTPKTRNAI